MFDESWYSAEGNAKISFFDLYLHFGGHWTADCLIGNFWTLFCIVMK